MKELEASEISAVSGGDVEIVQGESSRLSDIASAISSFFGSGSTETTALNANLGIRG